MVNIVLILLALFVLAAIYRALANKRRHRYLTEYQVPDAVLKRFRLKRQELTEEQSSQVQAGLQQYFHICQRARGRFVSMPSQVADDLWHEFILFTRNYEVFCQKAFGKYLHHTPVEAMAGPTQATDGIRRTWLHACRMESINPRQPERLPLLFALDAQLGIANGFFYNLNCRESATSSSNSFCASDIGCGGGGDGGGGDSSGDGGSSCGGGCGGGGD
jgi:hypothetical protein